MEQTLRVLDRIIEASLIGFAAFALFSISLTQICFAAGGLAWLTKVGLTRSWGQVQRPLGRVFLIFVLACVLSVVTAVDVSLSYKPLKKLLQIIIFFWVINTLQDQKSQETIFKILIASACLASLYGFYQAVAQGEVSLLHRVEGSMSVYMTFAGVLMLTALMAASRFLFHSPREAWVGCAGALLAACLLLTLARQAWLGLLTGLFFLIFVRQKKLLIALPLVLGLMVFASPKPVQDRILSMANLQDHTFRTRVKLWQGGWEIFKDYPLTGCGFKCIDTVRILYPTHTNILLKHGGLHNNFIQLAVDTGIVGLSAWLAVWVCYFLTLYRLNASDPENPRRWVLMGSAGAALGFLAAGTFEVNFYDSEVVMLLYFLMALPLASAPRQAST